MKYAALDVEYLIHLYEELLIGDNVSTTTHKQIFRAEEDFISKEEIEYVIEEIIIASESNDINKYKDLLEKVIQGYTKKDEIVDILSINENSVN